MMGLLVAAGGTGQDIAAGLIRVAYLTGLPYPEVFVIDSDLAGNDSDGTQTRHQVVDALHRRLVDSGASGTSFLEVLNPATLNRSERDAGAVRHVSDVFSQHGVLGEADRVLIDLLFDDEQQSVRIDDGFHGHPAVGALVVAAATANGAWSGLIHRVEELAARPEGLDVVFVGSVMGGVGTAVLPAGIRVLGARRPPPAERPKDRPGLTLSGVLQLPWFDLADLPGEGSKADVNTAKMASNATCLIRGYLEQTLEGVLDRAILIGLPSRVRRASHGGARQPETRHYVNVVSALHALGLVASSESKEPYNKLRGLLGVSIGDEARTHFLGFPNGPAVAGVSLHRLVDVAKSLTAFTSALLFEVAQLEPSVTHQADIRGVLRQMPSNERGAFRSQLQTLHELHVEIWRWLADSLESRAGSSRADVGLNAFVPDDGWERFRDVGLGTPRRLLGSAPLLLGRQLIRAVGPFPIPGRPDGKTAAWTLVSHARRRFLAAHGGL